MTRTKAALMIAPVLLSASIAAPAQQTKGEARTSASRAPANRVEPLRVINGELRGKSITGKLARANRPVAFTFTISRAEVVSGDLHLSGMFMLGEGTARYASSVKAMVAGTMAQAANPWPSAASAPPREKPKTEQGEQKQGREAKNPEAAGQIGQLAQSTQSTARKTPSPEGERNEQTQSLYAQASEETACGVLFLKLALSPELRTKVGAGEQPLQLGVALAAIDNQTGEEINAQICRLLRMKQAQAGDSSSSLEQLNRLLTK